MRPFVLVVAGRADTDEIRGNLGQIRPFVLRQDMMHLRRAPDAAEAEAETLNLNQTPHGRAADGVHVDALAVKADDARAVGATVGVLPGARGNLDR